LNSLSGKSHNLKRDEEYFRFQFEQLEQAKLEENEQEELESKLNVLVHAEEITETLYKANSYIADDEKCALNILRELKSDLDKLASYYSKAGEISGRMDHILIELKDIAGELESASSHIDYDPQQVEKIRERLSLFYELQQKHRVGSVRELIEIKDDFALKLNSVESCDAELLIIQKDIENSRSILLELAEKLHNEREKQIPVIERFVIDNLRQLGMPEAKFRIALTHEPELNENGRNSLKFLFSANRKAEPAEISRVASGGELSRLMLCFKMFISQSIALPTLILDEIDIGISGEIAGKMGTIMKKIAENNQVIAITHLPQIAAKGNIHYTVYKETVDDGARTGMKLLDNDGRVAELAKMLSGDVVSDAAVENARILLKN
ncbi:MAG: DNA repair protein RecN, partial [Bacteroidota bacterium]